MLFDRLYKKIVEEEEIFKASTPEEGKRRKEQYVKITIDDILRSATRNPDGSYDVPHTVNLSDMNLSELPVEFNVVNGGFYCQYNRLTSLKGSPKKCLDFNCSKNQLTSLKYAPSDVFEFNCSENLLTTLENSPKIVDGMFLCGSNQLVSLIGSPKIVPNDFWCSYNPLTSLEGAPKEVGGDFYCVSIETRFTEKEVRAVCDVKGLVFVFR